MSKEAATEENTTKGWSTPTGLAKGRVPAMAQPLSTFERCLGIVFIVLYVALMYGYVIAKIVEGQ